MLELIKLVNSIGAILWYSIILKICAGLGELVAYSVRIAYC